MITSEKLLKIEGIDPDKDHETNFVMPIPGLSTQPQADDACSFGKIAKSDCEVLLAVGGFKTPSMMDANIYCQIGWPGDLDKKGQGGYAFTHILFIHDHITAIHENYKKLKKSPNKISSLIYCIRDVCSYIQEMSNPNFKGKVFVFWSPQDGKYNIFVKLPEFREYLQCVLFVSKVQGKTSFNICTLFPISIKKLNYILTDSVRYQAITFNKGSSKNKISNQAAELMPAKPSITETKEEKILSNADEKKDLLEKEENLVSPLSKAKKKFKKKKNKKRQIKVQSAESETIKNESYSKILENLNIQISEDNLETLHLIEETTDIELVDVSASFFEVVNRVEKSFSDFEAAHLLVSEIERTEIRKKVKKCFDEASIIKKEIPRLMEMLGKYSQEMETNYQLVNELSLRLPININTKKVKIANDSYIKVNEFFLTENSTMKSSCKKLWEEYNEFNRFYKETSITFEQLVKSVDAKPVLLRWLQEEKPSLFIQTTRSRNQSIIDREQFIVIFEAAEKKANDAFINLIKLGSKFLKFCKKNKINVAVQDRKEPSYSGPCNLIDNIMTMKNLERLGTLCVERKDETINEFLDLYNELHGTTVSIRINPQATFKK